MNDTNMRLNIHPLFLTGFVWIRQIALARMWVRQLPKCAIGMICILAFGAHPCLAGKDPKAHDTFTFYLENDVFTGTDREYTNGIKLTWISRDLSSQVPPAKPEACFCEPLKAVIYWATSKVAHFI